MDDGFEAMETADRAEGTWVTLRFRDPADPGFTPPDRLARAERDWQGQDGWRFADGDRLSRRNEAGWSRRAATAPAADVAAAMDAAGKADDDYGLAKARGRKPDDRSL